MTDTRHYMIGKQDLIDERVFQLTDIKTGETFSVDIYTDGKLDYPEGANDTAESWRAWLGTFVGKTIQIGNLTPFMYFS